VDINFQTGISDHKTKNQQLHELKQKITNKELLL
jgi:hypothetical protein